MEEIYEQLGFKKPNFVENPYGIKIYFGTKGKDDWCIEIPKKLAQEKSKYYKCDNNFIIYFVKEEDVLRIAEMYTDLAKHMEKVNSEVVRYERHSKE